VDETDFTTLHSRYRFAFDVYRDLVAGNAATADCSDRPSVDQLQLEQQALEELMIARRDLLEALRMVPTAIH
jgi:hypothetical protein